MNGIASPMWPITICSFAKRSNTPAAISLGACSPVSMCQPQAPTDRIGCSASSSGPPAFGPPRLGGRGPDQPGPALGAIFGAGGEALTERIRSLDDDVRMAQTAEQFIHAQRLAPDPMVPMVNGIVARIMGERQITRVADLVSRTGIGERRLRRLFAEFVGVHTRWVIQRYRLHEAAERLAADEDVKLAALPLELGYFDQAHFARDFRAIVGRTPAPTPGPPPRRWTRKRPVATFRRDALLAATLTAAGGQFVVDSLSAALASSRNSSSGMPAASAGRSWMVPLPLLSSGWRATKPASRPSPHP